MIETTNYIEHYGLLRKKDAQGIYEPVDIRHSWNAPQVVTNHMLFKLQRHSDHHANAYKPYQILESLEDSPMLPHGYSASIILAMLPPLWFKIGNPLAEAANRKQIVNDKVLDEIKTMSLTTLIPVFATVTITTALMF